MKKFYHLLPIIIINLFLSNKNISSQEIPDGPYFGQEPPGMIPEVFAPGIISLEDRFESGCTFSPDGNECLIGITNSAWSYFSVLYTREEDGQWTEPERAPFLGSYDDAVAFTFSSDGQRVYFTSARPSYPPINIWMSERVEQDWTEPIKIPYPVSSSSDEWNVTVTGNNTLYFSSDRPGSQGIFRSEYINGNYSTAESIGYLHNSQIREAPLFIAPDESYLIFHSEWHEGYGWEDMYISYRKEDGSWTIPQNLGPEINTSIMDAAGNMSPDGKYFFFSRREAPYTTIDQDIYWVDSKIVFKPYIVTPIEDMYAPVNESFQFVIPSGTFNDYDDDTLYYSASLSNEDPLPTWLDFDSTSLTFSGIQIQVDTVNIKVTVTDSIGSSTSDEFNIFVNSETFITDNKIIPNKLNLYQNYPNPFNPSTTIYYSIPNPARVNLNIYNINGQKIKTLVNQFQKSGNYTIEWDGKDSNGKLVSPGIYFYKISTHSQSEIKRMLLFR